ncbi:oligosaccharide flippase family protein [Ralstonia sp. R-29]|uniref:oligosaccharide flippase family protein n=1 Tax=Ralstonia sp. R-29 TaxID=3404059 RepID=UPI003CF93611
MRVLRGRLRLPSLGRNFVAMVMWQAGTYLVPLLTFPYLTRTLGVEAYGALGIGMAVSTYALIWTDWGFNLSASRAIAQMRQDREAVTALFWNTLMAKAILALLSLMALLSALAWLAALPGLRAAAAVTLACWLCVPGSVLCVSWLFQGLERFELFATVTLVGKLLTLPMTFWLVRGPDDAWIAASVQAAGVAVTGGLSLWMVRRQRLVGPIAVTWTGMLAQWRGGWHVFVSTASVSLFAASNIVILSATVGAVGAALYAAADRLKTVANLMPAQINTVCYARVNTLFAAHPDQAAALTRRALAATVGVTLVGVVAVWTLAWWAVPWVLGREFSGVTPVLAWLTLGTLFGNAAYLLGLQVLLPFQRAGLRTGVMFAAGVLNLALAGALSLRWGATGAAAAIVLAEAAILVAFAWTIHHTPAMRAHLWRRPPVAGVAHA